MYSVILPVYNVDKFIVRSLESLINQTYKNFEIILVNDGSTDNSGQICDEYALKYDYIKVLHQKNAGSGKARQKGLDHAIGKYVVFVDPDDYINENALESNFHLIKNKEVDIIINGYISIQKNIFGKTVRKKNISDVQGCLNRDNFIKSFSNLNTSFLKPLWNKVYNLNFLKNNNISFSSQRLGQDVLFNYNAFKYVDSILINDECFYNYDSTRENSAVNKYWGNRLQFELNIYYSMINLFESFGSQSLMKQDELLALWHAILVEIRNIHYLNSPYSTRRKKIQRIREVSRMPEFKDVFACLDSSNINSFVSKWCFIFIKRKQYFIAHLLVSAYVKFKK